MSDVSARILARTSVSVSMSASWNAAFSGQKVALLALRCAACRCVHSTAHVRRIKTALTVTTRHRLRCLSGFELGTGFRRRAAETGNRVKEMRRRRGLLTWCPRLRLQVLVAVTTAVMTTVDARHEDNCTVPPEIHIGLLQPLRGPRGFESTGSAATMAVDDAQRQGYLNQTHVVYALIVDLRRPTPTRRNSAVELSRACRAA